MAIFELDLPTGVLAHSFGSAEQQAHVLATAVANALRFAIRTEGDAYLLVPGGKTPIPFFEQLSRQSLDWAKVTLCLTDERWVPLGHPHSNEALVRAHLLQNEAAAAHLLSLYREGCAYELGVAQVNEDLRQQFKRPVDVVVLGMGDDGHTASLFPSNSSLHAALSPLCSDLCVAMRAPEDPVQRISLTYPVLAQARMQSLLIRGHGKFLALSRAVQATPIHMPIQAFLKHPLEVYWCP